MVFILPLIGIPISISVFKYILIIILSGLILTVLVVVLGIISAFIAFKRGMDPDNMVTPIVTTSGDFIGITIVIVLTLILII
jgi:mgtE-like transporter